MSAVAQTPKFLPYTATYRVQKDPLTAEQIETSERVVRDIQEGRAILAPVQPEDDNA